MGSNSIPICPLLQRLLGMSYLELGDHEKAEPLLEAAVRANPNDDNLEMALARNLVDLGKYEAATPYLRSYLERNPKDQQAWYLLGKTYLQLSEDALGKIDQIDPNSVVAHEVAGEIDESMHNYDGALVEYKKAADMAPQQPGTHMHMANTFWRDRQMGFSSKRNSKQSWPTIPTIARPDGSWRMPPSRRMAPRRTLCRI